MATTRCGERPSWIASAAPGKRSCPRGRKTSGLTEGASDGEQQGRADGGAAVDSVLAKRALRKRDDQPQLARTGPTRLDGSGQVLVIGDSLEVLTSPYLKRYLPGIPLTVNAEGGYNSIQIFGLFEESFDPAQSVIVFDAGTNDNPAYPEILAGNLDKVAATVGDRCLVVPTIHGFTVDGVDNTGKNRVVRSFAANHPTTQVPDWARRPPERPRAGRVAGAPRYRWALQVMAWAAQPQRVGAPAT